MSKFVVVKEAPKELKTGEFLIDKPSFLSQIALHQSKKPKNGLTGLHYLRMIIDSISQAYDPENMTAYSVKAFKYEGRKFTTDQDIDDIIVDALTQDYPSVFSKYLDVKIKTRPSGTSLIYYVDSNLKGANEIFYKNGLSEAEPEPKKKSDKIVGRPAITNAQYELEKTIKTSDVSSTTE